MEKMKAQIYHPVFGYALSPPVAPAVARRNERERNRVKNVNEGYHCLRMNVPSAREAKKMSKVDILKHTINYIKQLEEVLGEKKPNIMDNLEHIDSSCQYSQDNSEMRNNSYFINSKPQTANKAHSYTRHASIKQENNNTKHEEVLHDDDILEVILNWQSS